MISHVVYCFSAHGEGVGKAGSPLAHRNLCTTDRQTLRNKQTTHVPTTNKIKKKEAGEKKKRKKRHPHATMMPHKIVHSKRSLRIWQMYISREHAETAVDAIPIVLING